MYIVSDVRSHFSSDTKDSSFEQSVENCINKVNSKSKEATELPKVQHFSSIYTRVPQLPQLSNETIKQELERFKTIQETNPEYAIQLVKLGQSIVEYATIGNTVALANILLFQAREGEILQWSLCRAFRAACLNGHLLVVRLLIEHGLNAATVGISEIPFEVLESHILHNDAKVTILNELYKSAQFDINQMRKSDSKTSLHLACENGLLSIIKYLIISHGDINAVSDDDSLPLQLLLKYYDASTQSKEAASIIQLLKSMGACTTL